MSQKDDLELAIMLHGHIAPGLALGVRMSRVAMERLGIIKGTRKYVGIAETSRCLADAMQATTGCTMGHANAIIQDYGKLALTLARVDTKEGVRVALKKNAHEHSALMKKWMLREGKLSRDEEKELGMELLKLNEEYLDIIDVTINFESTFDNSKIVKCEKCDELIPIGITVMKDKILCKACAGKAYYST